MDGTYWEILQTNIFLRSGETLRVNLGNRVLDEKILAQLREYYVASTEPKFRVEVFDCPEQGFRNFVDRESANQHRDWLLKDGVAESNIRIVPINRDLGRHGKNAIRDSLALR